MGQGQHDPPPGDTMYKANTRHGKQGSSNVGDVEFNEKGGNSGAASNAGTEGKEKKGRERASTMGGGDAHDHEEGFPASEKKQMEECLEEILGTLGEFRNRLDMNSQHLMTIAFRTVVFPTRFVQSGDLFCLTASDLPLVFM